VNCVGPKIGFEDWQDLEVRVDSRGSRLWMKTTADIINDSDFSAAAGTIY